MTPKKTSPLTTMSRTAPTPGAPNTGDRCEQPGSRPTTQIVEAMGDPHESECDEEWKTTNNHKTNTGKLMRQAGATRTLASTEPMLPVLTTTTAHDIDQHNLITTTQPRALDNDLVLAPTTTDTATATATTAGQPYAQHIEKGTTYAFLATPTGNHTS